MQPGGRVEISGLPLKQLMQQAWGIPADSIVDAPKWMDTDRYEIVAKMPGNGAPPAPNSPVDIDSCLFHDAGVARGSFQARRALRGSSPDSLHANGS